MKKTLKDTKEPLYCLVGRNRLSGDREIISSPMTKSMAEAVRERLSRTRGKKAYANCKVELYIS